MKEQICGENAVCHNTQGSYDCDCLAGYTSIQGVCRGGSASCFGREGRVTDIDECSNSPCGHSDGVQCVNEPGTYRCECKEGFDSLNDCKGRRPKVSQREMCRYRRVPGSECLWTKCQMQQYGKPISCPPYSFRSVASSVSVCLDSNGSPKAPIARISTSAWYVWQSLSHPISLGRAMPPSCRVFQRAGHIRLQMHRRLRGGWIGMPR